VLAAGRWALVWIKGKEKLQAAESKLREQVRRGYVGPLSVRRPNASVKHVKVPTGHDISHRPIWRRFIPLQAWPRRASGLWFLPCFGFACLGCPPSPCGRWKVPGGLHMQRRCVLRNVWWIRGPLPITRKEVVLHEHHPQTSTWSGPLLFVVYGLWALISWFALFARPHLLQVFRCAERASEQSINHTACIATSLLPSPGDNCGLPLPLPLPPPAASR
jgi:hypothetical protein